MYFKRLKIELSGIIKYNAKDMPNRRIVKKYSSIVFLDFKAMNKKIIAISE